LKRISGGEFKQYVALEAAPDDDTVAIDRAPSRRLIVPDADLALRVDHRPSRREPWPPVKACSAYFAHVVAYISSNATAISTQRDPRHAFRRGAQ
jgi:hypothetical protein